MTARATDRDTVLELLNTARRELELARHDEAESLLETALEIARATGAPALNADALEGLGALERARGRYPQAQRILNEALGLAERACGSDSLEVAGILNELGILAKFSGRFDEGRGHYERALAILLARVGPDAVDVAAIYHNLGGIEHARGNFAAAEPYARAAIEVRARALGHHHLDVARDRAAHAPILHALGEHDPASAIVVFSFVDCG